MLVLQIKNSQMPNSVIRLTILREKNNMNPSGKMVKLLLMKKKKRNDGDRSYRWSRPETVKVVNRKRQLRSCNDSVIR